MKNLRENLILSFILIFSIVLITRLFYLQIIKGNYYRALSFGLHDSFSENQVKRGEIFFSGGEPLALNKEYFVLFALPNKVQEKEKTAKILSEILKMNEKEILEKINNDKKFVIIKENLNEEELEKIKKLNLDGVFIESKIGRYYPQKNMASNIVGFVDTDGNGRYGLEEYYDEVLKKGENLILTIDYRIQYEAEKLLEKANENLEIEGGQIIVAEPNSGKILAFANFPNFDPNSYNEFAKNLEIFKNPGTQNLFEPGSVFKPITMAAALEEGKITPQTTYRDPGEIRINGWVIRNYGNRVYPGEITMTEVLEKSINTGAVFAKNQIENSTFLNYLQNFGFFEKTGIDLPEIYSENRELKNGREVNFATASFGQGVAITPIQLLRAYCAIANGGKMVTPYLVENFKKESEQRKILSQKTVSQLTSMLVSVVEKGFGKKAKVQGYYIAGKTGTALQPLFGKKGYSEKTWQTFIGFFPAYNPKVVILVKLDNPKTKTAEYSAVPIFHDLADYIIRLYQIPPDYE
jgi:cell division protein FtsI/penicillin-binding protein 2